MAVKDWEKQIEDKDYIEWKHKEDFRWVGINRLDESFSTKTKKWHVGGNRINEKDFKTKSQAMSFAKSYMRNNQMEKKIGRYRIVGGNGWYVIGRWDGYDYQVMHSVPSYTTMNGAIKKARMLDKKDKSKGIN